ncbi:MAG: hypothetical protein AAGA21_22295 [Pseudomonadota bacterium]
MPHPTSGQRPEVGRLTPGVAVGVKQVDEVATPPVGVRQVDEAAMPLVTPK